jgi:serine/threonine-protein phosphatase 2A regulatory subunit B
MERAPVKTVQINPRVKNMLCELYESEAIFDKFEVSISNGGDRMLSGSYG